MGEDEGCFCNTSVDSEDCACCTAEEVDPGYPYGEMDAQKWADEFKRLFPKSRPGKDVILDWFANAIMTGYDNGRYDQTTDDVKSFDWDAAADYPIQVRLQDAADETLENEVKENDMRWYRNTRIYRNVTQYTNTRIYRNVELTSGN